MPLRSDDPAGERDPQFATTLARGLEVLRRFTPDEGTPAPAEMRKCIATDVPRWTKMARDNGIQAE